MKYKSVKSYVDELIDSVQDFDNHYGVTHGHIDSERMKRYRKAKSEIRKHIIELRKKLESKV